MPFNLLPLRSAQSALAARPGTERPSEAETTFFPLPGQRSPRTKKEEEKKLWSFVDWWQYRFAPSAAGGSAYDGRQHHHKNQERSPEPRAAGCLLDPTGGADGRPPGALTLAFGGERWHHPETEFVLIIRHIVWNLLPVFPRPQGHRFRGSVTAFVAGAVLAGFAIARPGAGGGGGLAAVQTVLVPSLLPLLLGGVVGVVAFGGSSVRCGESMCFYLMERLGPRTVPKVFCS